MYGEAETLSEFLGISEYDPECECEDWNSGKVNESCYWHGINRGLEYE